MPKPLDLPAALVFFDGHILPLQNAGLCYSRIQIIGSVKLGTG